MKKSHREYAKAKVGTKDLFDTFIQDREDAVNFIYIKLRSWLEKKKQLWITIEQHVGDYNELDEDSRMFARKLLATSPIYQEVLECDKQIKRLTYLWKVYTMRERGEEYTDWRELKERAKRYPISDIIDLDRAGKGRCPLHKDNHPSLKVYENNTWYCFQCHTGGDSIDLVQAKEGLSWKDAVRRLA